MFTIKTNTAPSIFQTHYKKIQHQCPTRFNINVRLDLVTVLLKIKYYAVKPSFLFHHKGWDFGTTC